MGLSLNCKFMMAVAVSTVCATVAFVESKFDPETKISLPKADLEYVKYGAVKFAVAFGISEHGAHGTFLKLLPKFETSLHTHTSAYHGVVLKVIVTNPYPGEDDTP